MSEVAEPVKPKRGRGRPPGARNKPKPLIVKAEPKKAVIDVGINSLHPAPRIAKEIRRLSEETGFTLKRIYDDMCEAGVIEIQTLYLEIIIARKEIQKALDALDGKITAKRSTGAQPEPPAPVRNGEPQREVRSEARQPKILDPEPQYPEDFSDQPDVAPIQRGLATPPRAHLENPAPTGVDPNFANSFEDPLNEPEESEEEMEESTLE